MSTTSNNPQGRQAGSLGIPAQSPTEAPLLDLIGDEAKRSAAGAASYKRYQDHFDAEVVAPRLYTFLMQSTRPPRSGVTIGAGPRTSLAERDAAWYAA